MKRSPTSGASAASLRVPSRSAFGETPSARSKRSEDSSRSRPFGTATVMISFVIRSSEAERSEEHTSELQSRPHLVCRLLLEKKKKHQSNSILSTTNSNDEW